MTLPNIHYINNPRVIIGLTLLVVVLSILIGGHRLYGVFFSPSPTITDNPDLLQAKPTPATTTTPDIDYGISLAELNVFGDATKPAIIQQENIEVTRLQLVLKGVLASNTEHNALALVSEGQSPESAFAANDVLPGGAMLKEIHADHVIIQHEGRLQRLPLKGLKSLSKIEMRELKAQTATGNLR